MSDEAGVWEDKWAADAEVVPVERDPPRQSGERRLIIALLGDAFKLRGYYVAHSTPPPPRRYTARVLVADKIWIASAREHPMSFLWCCSMLGWSPDVMRRRYKEGVRVDFGFHDQTKRAGGIEES